MTHKVTERDEYPPYDEPHDWVIFIEPITTAQARELGAILGANGYTGTFHDGPYAHHMRKYKQLRDEYRRLMEQVKGGDEDGNETVHQA